MIPDTVLQKVRFSPHRITRMKLMSFSHAVLDPNDVVSQRSLALPKANDHVDGFFHLLFLCPLDVWSNSCSNAYLSINRKALQLRDGTL